MPAGSRRSNNGASASARLAWEWTFAAWARYLGGKMFSAAITLAAHAVLDQARSRGLRIVTAESCTGGLIAAALTAIPGSSDILERGFVTYSNKAKIELLGVPAELIAAHGAVSMEAALAMAEGALKASRADIAIAVTGIAGPGGGSDAKPVGLVHFAVARTGRVTLHHEQRFGDIGREAVRERSVELALSLLGKMLD